MRIDRTGSRKNLTTHNVFPFNAAKKNAHVIASAPFVKKLPKHFNTGAGRLLGLTNTYDLNLFANLDDAAFYPTGNNSATTGDRKYIFNRHKELFVDLPFWKRDISVALCNQLQNRLTPFVINIIRFQSLQGRTPDNWRRISGELIG